MKGFYGFRLHHENITLLSPINEYAEIGIFGSALIEFLQHNPLPVLANLYTQALVRLRPILLPFGEQVPYMMIDDGLWNKPLHIGLHLFLNTMAVGTAPITLLPYIRPTVDPIVYDNEYQYGYIVNLHEQRLELYLLGWNIDPSMNLFPKKNETYPIALAAYIPINDRLTIDRLFLAAHNWSIINTRLDWIASEMSVFRTHTQVIFIHPLRIENNNHVISRGTKGTIIRCVANDRRMHHKNTLRVDGRIANVGDHDVTFDASYSLPVGKRYKISGIRRGRLQLTDETEQETYSVSVPIRPDMRGRDRFVTVVASQPDTSPITYEVQIEGQSSLSSINNVPREYLMPLHAYQEFSRNPIDIGLGIYNTWVAQQQAVTADAHAMVEIFTAASEEDDIPEDDMNDDESTEDDHGASPSSQYDTTLNPGGINVSFDINQTPPPSMPNPDPLPFNENNSTGAFRRIRDAFIGNRRRLNADIPNQETAVPAALRGMNDE